MSEEKNLREKVFEACDYLANEKKNITRDVVRSRTGGSNRDVSKYISEWKEEVQKTAIVVAIDSEISQQEQESAAISQSAAPNSAPIKQTTCKADIAQIKLEAQSRVKAKRLAVIKVAQVYEENPDLLPEEIKKEIEEAEMAAISTPLSHRPYYDPNALFQAVIDTL